MAQETDAAPVDLDEQDFQDEIRAHLAIAAEERVAAGADRRSAELASLKDFGNLSLSMEAARRVWTPSWLEAFREVGSDTRYAIRTLRKNPAFSLTVVCVLTLGIGLNAAVFTMLKGIAFAPLAGVDGSAGLHEIYGETSAGRAVSLSYADYQHLRDHHGAFSGLFGSTLATVGLGRGPSSRSLSSELVTGNYFQVLGVRAQIGRTLLPSDEISPGGHPVVVLSDRLWRHDFGGDPDIVGNTININDYPLTVVGVADPRFHGTIVSYDNEVFIPMMMASQLGLPFGSVQTIQGYLRPATTAASAAAQTDALWATLSRNRSIADATERLRIAPFWRSPGSPQSYVLPTLIVLSAMGLLVLAIACANIAGLVLVRALSRRGEVALRLALGAPRARVVRLLIVESLVLAVPGAVLGVLLAWRAIPVLVSYGEWLAAPQRLFFNTEVDSLVLGFAVLAAGGSALLFGFVPALHSSNVDLMTVINQDASPRSVARGRLRSGLVVAQVAVSLLLLVGAGLVTRSFDAARRADLGFDPNQVTSIRLDVRQNGYDGSRGRLFYRRLLDAVRAEAGTLATLAAYNPMSLIEMGVQRVTVEGYDAGPNEDLGFITNTVAPDYFRTLRIALVAGRPFYDHDDEMSAPVVMVNNTLAQRFWGGAADSIGKRIRIGDGDWRTVVGVAADVKYLRVNESPRSYVYLPFLQSYRSTMILHTRGPAPVDVLVTRARAHVSALDGNLPIDAKPLTERIAGTLVFFNLAATMLFIFGVAGMALAAIGTYGLVSYTVRQSTHEIGIRMALGASGPSVVREFFVRGLRLGAAGAALGLAVAFAGTRFLQNVLYGVSATDTASFATALAIVLGGVVLATLVPAWRASRTDPLSALRHQ
jgi:predicted permease